MKNVLKSTAFALILGGLIVPAFSGTLTIKNENTTDLIVQLMPEGADVNFKYERPIQKGETVELTLTAADLGDKSIYALNGRTGTAVMKHITGDTCKKLSVEKHYSVVFTNDMAGTTCVPVIKEDPMTNKSSN